MDELLSAEEGNHCTTSLTSILLGSSVDLTQWRYSVGTLGWRGVTECLTSKHPCNVETRLTDRASSYPAGHPQ